MNVLARLRLSAPLLGRELREQSAQRKTYLIRALFTLSVFYLFVTEYERLTSRSFFPAEFSLWMLLGSGGALLSNLIKLQLSAIYLFVPALMVGVIAREKERDSLSLLLLTQLSPRQIVLEKFLGRLVPILTLQLAALPLFAVCYSLGGVSTEQVVSGAYAVLLACVQVASWSLLFSSFCRTTAAAFGASYVTGAILFLFTQQPNIGMGITTSSYLSLWPHEVFRVASLQNLTLVGCAGVSSPALVSVAVSLVLSWFFLTRRAFVRRKNLLLALFRRLDRFMDRANNLVGNVVLVADRQRLPDHHPVAWRELTCKALGRPVYLVRLFLVTEVPVLFACAIAFWGHNYHYRVGGKLVVVVYVLWVLNVLLIGILASGALASERANQTLGVLLSTPLSRREILVDKLAAIRRVERLLWLPFLTVFGFEAALKARYWIPDGLTFVALSATPVVLYQWLLTWYAVWLGLRSPNRLRVLLIYLVTVAVLFLLLFVSNRLTMLLNPIGLVQVLARFPFDWLIGQPSFYVVVAANVFVWGLIALALRQTCLSQADRLLHRQI